MLIRGTIIDVRPALDKEGKHRSFTTRDNKKFLCYQVCLDSKRFGENGQEFKDEFLLDYNKEDDGVNAVPFLDLVAASCDVECKVIFSRSEWNNRRFQELRLYSVVRKEG